MNVFDNVDISKKSFAYADLLGTDKWIVWTPVFGSLTVVGTPTYTGRFKVVGRQCFFQVTLVSSTSIASVAGTDYLNLPLTAAGLTGMATMTNDTSNVAVGVCHVDVATSRVYLPTQTASGNTFNIAGTFEV